MSQICRRSFRRRRLRPGDAARFAVRNPVDAITALSVVLPDDIPAPYDLLLLIGPDGFASKLLAPNELRGNDMTLGAALDATIAVVIDAVDDWNIGAVVGAIIRDESTTHLSHDESQRWFDAAARLDRAGVPVFDVLVLSPDDWASLSWHEHDMPTYGFW